MGTPVPIKNASDAWVNEEKPSANFGSKARLYLNAGGADEKEAFIFFAKPWPFGARIISATLRLYAGDSWGTSTTLTVQRVTEKKWDESKITWNNKPASSGATATANRGSTSPGDLYQFDVTALVQAVANGGPWYGFRITTNRASDGWLHSAQSAKGALRPQLIVEWSEAPDQPSNLQPSGGRAVSMAKPTVSCDYNDRVGDKSIDAMRVQTGSSEASVLAGGSWDSGWVTVTTPSLDLSTTSFPGASAGPLTYWKCFVRDADGNESVASQVESFTLAAKGTLTITSPTGGGIFEPTPTVSWTLTGATQKAYLVAVAYEESPEDWLWDTGKITSTDTSVSIPLGVIEDASKTYRIIVLVWDTVARVAVAGSPIYTEAFTTVTVQYDGAVTGVTGLSATSHAWKPIEQLAWSRTSAPNTFVIQRSHDGGTTWKYVDEKLPSELTLGGTNYGYDDATAAPYEAYHWRVLAVVGGHQSAAVAGVSGTVRRLAPFLMRPDGSDICCFLNASRSRQNLDFQELHETMSGPPVLVTQRLGGKAGSVSGRFLNEALPGQRTAKEMYDSFNEMRKDAGTPLRLILANEAFQIVAYNMQSDTVTDTNGVSYVASFDWFEV